MWLDGAVIDLLAGMTWVQFKETWPVITLLFGGATGYLADGLRDRRGAKDRRSEARREMQRATLYALQDVTQKLLSIAQDAFYEREATGDLSNDRQQALYEAHVAVEALRVRVTDDQVRSLMEDFTGRAYDFGTVSTDDEDQTRLVEKFDLANGRLGEVLRSLYEEI